MDAAARINQFFLRAVIPAMLSVLVVPSAQAATCQATVQRITNLSNQGERDVDQLSRLLTSMQQAGAQQTYCRDLGRAEAQYFKVVRSSNASIKACGRLEMDCRDEAVPRGFIKACKALSSQRSALDGIYDALSSDKQRFCR